METEPIHTDPPPLPVEALSYSTRAHQRRPGIIVAVGVMSIVVAAFSFLGSLSDGFSAFGFGLASVTMRSLTPPAAPATVVPATTPVYAPPTDSNVNGSGLKQSDRAVVANVLSSLEPLSEARSNELDYFLAESGASAFPNAGSALSEKQVKSQISRSGVSESSGPDDPGYTYYDLSWGTLKIYDDKAELVRGNGAAAPVSTSTTPPAPIPAFNGFAQLNSAQVNSVMQAVKTTLPNTLDAGQTTALRNAIKSPSQRLLPAMFVQTPVTSATKAPDGSVTVIFTGGGTTTIGPNGTSSTSTAAMTPGIPRFNFSIPLLVVSGVEALLSFGLAILLLVAGILTLRQSPRGKALHRFFAWVKIPLALAGGVIYTLIMLELANSFSSSIGMPASALSWVYVGMSIFKTLLAIAYPVALLIVFRTQTVKDYYNSVSAL